MFTYIKEVNDKIHVSFPYDERIIGAIRRFKGRKWDAEKKVWIVDASKRQAVEKMLEKHLGAGCLDWINVDVTIKRDLPYKDVPLFVRRRCSLFGLTAQNGQLKKRVLALQSTTYTYDHKHLSAGDVITISYTRSIVGYEDDDIIIS